MRTVDFAASSRPSLIAFPRYRCASKTIIVIAGCTKPSNGAGITPERNSWIFAAFSLRRVNNPVSEVRVVNHPARIVLL